MANKNSIRKVEHDTKHSKTSPRTDKYNKIGIYQMKCLDCPLKYTGQAGRALHIRCKEHMQAIRNNNTNLVYSSYILNMGHTYGTITDTVDITRT
jgi:hypothetical protein